MPFSKSNQAGTKFGVGFSSEQIAADIKAMTARQAKQDLAALKDDLERQIDTNMQRVLVTDRDPKRRKPGARHAVGSIKIDVRGDAFPFEIMVTGINSPKIAALEFGARPHSIDAVNGDFLQFPATKGLSTEKSSSGVVRLESGRRPSRRARASGRASTKGDRAATGKRVRVAHVDHPGNRPYGFIRKAIEEIIGQRFG